MIDITFTNEALQDLTYWVKMDRKKAQKIMDLIESIQRNPFEGIGKPETLRYHLSNCWSRRIDLEHRLVYQVMEKTIRILSCRYHY